MARLEQIVPGSRLSGVDGSGELVEILAARSYGVGAIEVTYKGSNGVLQALLYRSDESNLHIAQAQPRFSFQGDGALLRLASEALRIRLAHLFDPFLAVRSAQIEALPHQLTGVYGNMLPKLPLRFLLADDPGAGKTIMAGLLIKELLIRGDLERCLVVAPGSLVEQWQDELHDKFELDFDILTRDQLIASPTGNPLAERPRLIARLDMLARSDELRQKLKSAPVWDLVICDEAHRMSASFFSGEVKYTKRYLLGQALGQATRNLLLLTATPHNGKEEDFQLFMGLLDSDRFEGRFREGAHKVDVSDMMRRLTKEEMTRFDGTRLFPERRAYTVRYSLSPGEAALYEAVTEYVREEMDRADRIEEGERRRNTVGFALQILQRRLASSPAAIHESLKRRLKRLEARLEEERLLKRGQEARAALSLPLLSWDEEDLEEATDDEIEEIEGEVIDQATASRTIAELETEIRVLRGLELMARRVRQSREDRKWQELDRILDDPYVYDPARDVRRKIVIFTEPRDTLLYLAERIRDRTGEPDSVVVIHGGVPRARRRAAIAAFNDDPAVRFLIANDAAGEGVNLHRGSHLMVNYDLPWNPNRLEQRFGRIHRIGQTEVCHLWNLVAGETREGEVFIRLLEKLDNARKTLGGKVYDVLGELFEARELRELVMEAIRYGELPETRERLFRKIDTAVDAKRIEELVARNKLTKEGLDPSIIAAMREEVERADARRLQPHYIRSFFEEAFACVGGVMRQRESGRFEVKRVPPILRDRDRLIGRGDPVLPRYERICFDKARIDLPGSHRAALIAPGHPLLDAIVDITLERYRNLLSQGAILVDENDPGDKPRVLVYLDHAIRDGRLDRNGKPRVVSERLQFVFLDANDHAADGGAAPYLDCRPPTAAEHGVVRELLSEPWLAGTIEDKARGYAIANLVPQHLVDVKARRLREIDRVEEAVKDRLRREILHWQHRALELELQESAGKPQRLNSENARRQVEALEDRLQKRLAELAQERAIQPLPPEVKGAALVVPIGWLHGRLGQPATPDGFAEDRAEVERLAMEAVMAAERDLGRIPRDVSAERHGYDIESRDPETGSLIFLEVKGRRADGRTLTITRNEMLRAFNVADGQTGSRYLLAIVRVEDGYAGEPIYVPQPETLFGPEPGFAEVSRAIDLTKAEAAGGKPL